MSETQVETTAPRVRAPRGTIVTGEFAPVRKNSRLAKIVEMLDRRENVDAIATACRADFKRSDILWWMKYLRTNHGIGFAVAEDGATSLVLPEGKTVADCVRT